MFLRKYWIPLSVCIVAIAGVCLYMLTTQTPKAPIVIVKPVEPLPKSEVKAPVGDTSQGGHVHADGTWHSEPHTETSAALPGIDNPDESIADAGSLSDFGGTESEATVPWEYSEEAQRLAENFTRDWTDFQQSLLSKYRVLFTPDEFRRIAETKQGRRKLKSQAAAMVTDTLDKLEELLRPLPPEMTQKILTDVEASLQQYNPGVDPKYMKESLEQLKARLN